jgi:hypothetical protein
MQASKVIDLLNAALCPQAFTLLTVTLPAAVPHVQVMLVVLCPAVIVAPVGTVHNCVTPVTAGVVKVTPTWFGHTDATLVILAGVAGRRVSDALRSELPPQLLKARTLKVPVVKVLGTLITIELPLLVTIVQPVGTVH